MRKHVLYAGVAAAALMLGASGAMAQAVDQTTTNGSLVNNNASSITSSGGLGMGASASIGATGAVSSASVSGVNQIFNSPVGGFMNATVSNTTASVFQSTTNNGDVTNGAPAVVGGSNPSAAMPQSIAIGSGNALAGSSVGISATGALSSLSISGVGVVSFTPPTVGNVDQTTTSNSANVTNLGTIVPGMTPTGNPPMLINNTPLVLSGDGASASVSATGAIAAVGVSSNNATGFTAMSIGGGTAAVQGVSNAVPGTINQTATNTTSGKTISNTSTGVTVGDLTGKGASVSVGATGAATSVAVASIGSASVGAVTLGGNGGSITQHSTNGATISNTGGTTATGAVSGDGASVSTSATGAIASVSLTSIASNSAANIVGDVTQGSGGNTPAAISNTGTVTNTGTINAPGALGLGASIAISATGAAASVSATSINDTGVVAGQTVGHIAQLTNNASTGIVNNTGTITTGALAGNGSSASISATGAMSSVSFRAVK